MKTNIDFLQHMVGETIKAVILDGDALRFVMEHGRSFALEFSTDIRLDVAMQ